MEEIGGVPTLSRGTKIFGTMASKSRFYNRICCLVHGLLHQVHNKKCHGVYISNIGKHDGSFCGRLSAGMEGSKRPEGSQLVILPLPQQCVCPSQKIKPSPILSNLDLRCSSIYASPDWLALLAVEGDSDVVPETSTDESSLLIVLLRKCRK